MSVGDTALDAARALLGVAPGADEHVLRKAFRAAAKLAHPDRAGGDAARFRAVLDAYHALRDAPAAVPARTEGHLAPVTIDPAMAVSGGVVEVLSGLAPGDRVAKLGAGSLYDGARVSVSDGVLHAGGDGD